MIYSPNKRCWFLLTGFSLLFLAGCSSIPGSQEEGAAQFILREFDPLTNWNKPNFSHDKEQKKLIFLDYTDAIQTGFIIPSIRQIEEGAFQMEFQIKNTTAQPTVYMYKLFYQNASYKFPERDKQDTMKQHVYASENFYGSWEDVERTFSETEEIPADGKFHTVTDHFRIVGNPREEKRYYRDGKNDRWKRNPRVGFYEFLLVVTVPENIQQHVIPDYISHIGKLQDSVFVNPFFYFRYGKGTMLPNTLIVYIPDLLKVVANPDPGSGIYIHPGYFPKEKVQDDFTSNCGQDPELYASAPFQQFIHYIDPTTKYSNIPVIADVLNEGYSKTDYNWNKQFYSKEELISITASTASHPCETVVSDPVNHKIILKNPGTTFGKWEKQNVGVITRNGFTYGKWTVKAKLTELLNQDNLWNGLTNAIWLITQDQGEWNLRRDCTKEGYMANYYGGQQDQRIKNVGYSEIDFEILKTVHYCPGYVLPPAYLQGKINQSNVRDWNIPLPGEVLAEDDMIQVACTNWDMACWEPSNFNSGCNPITYEGQTFWAHRWDHNYRAITEKTPERDDELFGSDFYYFQIDWQPEAIIWRIGPSMDNLRVVGYVDQTITSIPNNQMLLIISQEFHNTRWWIGSMYSQDNIPFPKNDIIGEIYEVIID